MPAFAITAIDQAGVRRSLREAAPDEAQLRAKLRALALWPVQIRPVSSGRKLARLKLATGDFVPLLHQLEMQLRAGVTADFRRYYPQLARVPITHDWSGPMTGRRAAWSGSRRRRS